MLVELGHAVVASPPMPYRLLKLAEGNCGLILQLTLTIEDTLPIIGVARQHAGSLCHRHPQQERPVRSAPTGLQLIGTADLVVIQVGTGDEYLVKGRPATGVIWVDQS